MAARVNHGAGRCVDSVRFRRLHRDRPPPAAATSVPTRRRKNDEQARAGGSPCRGGRPGRRRGVRPAGQGLGRDPRHPIPEVRAVQRPDADRPRGPQGADRGGQRLVPRRLEEREARQDRLRPPLRAPHVQRLASTSTTTTSRPLEKVGATDLNGTTNEDRTNYFQNVPASALDYALFMESDRMGHLLGAIDQAKLDEQRGVVQNEKRQGDNQPYGKVQYLISRERLPGRPPLLVDGDRLDGGPQRRLARRREGVVQDLLRPEQRRPGDRRRRRRPPTSRRKVEKYFGDIPPGPPIAKHVSAGSRR